MGHPRPASEVFRLLPPAADHSRSMSTTPERVPDIDLESIPKAVTDPVGRLAQEMTYMQQIATNLGADVGAVNVRQSLIRWLGSCGAAFCWSKHLEVLSMGSWTTDPWRYWCKCCSNERARRRKRDAR